MSYLVHPYKPSFRIQEWFQSTFAIANVGCSGCASVVVSLVLLVWASSADVFGQTDFGQWFSRLVAGSFIAYLMITILVYGVRKIRLSRAEARKATADAMALMKSVKEHSEYLSYKAQSAAHSLKAAAFELQEEAFAPFWDAIERAASDLGECHTSCQWLSISAPKYDDILRGREHNFPDCFNGIETLPDCRPLLEEFYRLVRLAQRDFRFANIWELRQTRKVLIAGFATLGEAIKSLEATVVRSIADLKKTIEERTIQASPASTVKGVALMAFFPFP